MTIIAGFTFGYNRSLLANRVHDILTAVAFVKGHEKTKTVDLLGIDKAGPWVLLARARGCVATQQCIGRRLT